MALPRGALYSITPEPPRIDKTVAFYDLTNCKFTPYLSVRFVTVASSVRSSRREIKMGIGFYIRSVKFSPYVYRQALIAIQLWILLRLPPCLSPSAVHCEELVRIEGSCLWSSKITLHLPCKSSIWRQCRGLFSFIYILCVYLAILVVSVPIIYVTSTNARLGDNLISNISYVPPVPHSRPATFQAVIDLPGDSTVYLTIDVTKAFLRYTEHPPDAQRGWDLPPAIILPLPGSNASITEHEFAGRIYTPPLLVDLATPDFSMPYNVIIFSCSLIAFIFGSIFNLLTRKFVVVRLGSQLGTSKSKHD